MVALHQRVVHHKEMALGKWSIVVNEEYRTVHTLAQAVLGKGETILPVRGKLLVEAHSPAVQHHKAQFQRLGKVISNAHRYPVTVLAYPHYSTLGLNLRKLEPVLLLLALAVCHRHLCAVLRTRLRCEYERAFA